MSRTANSSLRFRLSILIAVSLLPALVLNFYTAVDQRRWSAEELQARALGSARGVAEEQAHVVDGVHELLSALALVPTVRRSDPGSCPEMLSDLVRRHPRYVALDVRTRDGEVACEGAVGEGELQDLRASYAAVERALESREFVAGHYRFSSGWRPLMSFALPIADARGQVSAVLTATIEMDWLSRHTERVADPTGTTLTIIDTAAVVRVRFPDPERWVGWRLAEDADLRQILRRPGGEGVVRARGLDGVRRLYAVTPLPERGEPSAYVTIGIPTAEAYAAANRVLGRNLAILLLLGVLSVSGGWWVGTRLILDPLRSLAGATRRLASGDLAARVEVSGREGELAEFAHSFNEMAGALQRRTHETAESLAALRQSEERYRSVVEATAAIAWSTSPDGEFTSPQPLWSAFTGQSYEQLRGEGWLDALHPEDREHFRTSWRAAIRGRTLFQGEQRLRRHDGEYRHMIVRAVPIPRSGGEPREWIGVAHDITNRKRAEDERDALLAREREARAEAEAANRAKSDFLAVVSHELRTPLTSIISYAELLETDVEGVLTGRHREFVDRIGVSAWNLAELVEQILEFTRLEAGRVTVEASRTDLVKLAHEVAGDMAPLAAQKSLPLVLDVPDAPVFVETDGGKVRQILLNLLGNAVKFTDAGEVRLRLEPVERGVGIQVEDTGPGIAAEHLDRIWETFWQAENPLTRRAGGTGLGLTIVRRLTHLLGGEISVTSEPGVGSTFTLYLPQRWSGVVEDLASAGGTL